MKLPILFCIVDNQIFDELAHLLLQANDGLYGIPNLLSYNNVLLRYMESIFHYSYSPILPLNEDEFQLVACHHISQERFLLLHISHNYTLILHDYKPYLSTCSHKHDISKILRY